MPVVIFRLEKGPDDPYAVALRQAGFDPQFIPVLQFEFMQAHELATALLDSSKFSGMILTSQTAVDSCIDSLSHTLDGWQKVLAEQWQSLPVFVVGKATSQAAGKLGLTTTGAISGSAEALARTILEYFGSHDKASLKPLLFPCGSLRRETLPTVLPKGGVNVHSIVCYNTVADPNIARNLRGLAEKKILNDQCWGVFFSPSGVNFALQHLKTIAEGDKLKFAAIGPTTAEALTNAGLPPSAVASKPTPDSLIQAMLSVHR